MKKVVFLMVVLFFLTSSYVYSNSLSDGLLFYLSFDNCNAMDDSGNGFDGELHGDIQCVDGKYGKALYLPTSNEYISIDKPYTVNDFTLSFWVKLDGKAGNRGDHSYNMFLQGANENSASGYANEFNFGIRDLDNALEICWDELDHDEPCHHSPSKDIFDGEFHHIVYVKQGERVDLYVDGEYFYTFTEGLDGTAVVSYTVIGQDQDCYMGCFDEDQILKGTIDELRLYNRALSENEIEALYNYSSGMCSYEELQRKYNEGFEAGIRYCREHPQECQLEEVDVYDYCASFDITTQTFHVPCFITGQESYDLYFKLTNIQPITLQLREVR